MHPSEYVKGGTLKIIAKPNSTKSEILSYDTNKDALKVAIAAVPDKDKANKELIKFFSKKYKLSVRIIRGLKSREKLLKIT